MRLGGITDLSTIDWRGHNSLVVYLAGCNMDPPCPYCHNPGLIPKDSGEEVPIEYIEERIKYNLPYIDSVVICGGEPTTQPGAVIQIAELANRLGLKVMLNTNCLLPVTTGCLLTSPIDTISLDTKLPHPVSFDQTLEECMRHRVEIEVRTTIVPGLIDSKLIIGAISDGIRFRCHSYILQQFDNTGEVFDPEFKDVDPPSHERMMELGREAVSMGVKNVFVRTREFGLERVE